MTAFRRQIADATPAVKFTQEADVFLRACALGVWQRTVPPHPPRHVEYYNAIYTRAICPLHSVWELSHRRQRVPRLPGVPTLPDAGLRQGVRPPTARRFIDLVT